MAVSIKTQPAEAGWRAQKGKNAPRKLIFAIHNYFNSNLTTIEIWNKHYIPQFDGFGSNSILLHPKYKPCNLSKRKDKKEQIYRHFSKSIRICYQNQPMQNIFVELILHLTLNIGLTVLFTACCQFNFRLLLSSHQGNKWQPGTLLFLYE